MVLYKNRHAQFHKFVNHLLSGGKTHIGQGNQHTSRVTRPKSKSFQWKLSILHSSNWNCSNFWQIFSALIVTYYTGTQNQVKL